MDVDVGGWLLELETEADVVYFVAMIQYGTVTVWSTTCTSYILIHSM
jgi:hypothetical protein